MATNVSTRRWAEIDASPFGLNIAGYLTAESGMGQMARLFVAAAASAGIPHATVTYGRTEARRGAAAFGARVSGSPAAMTTAPHDVNLVCVNADELPNFVADVDRSVLEGRYNIGMWAWETGRFPRQWRRSFRLVDEVWANSRHAAKAISVHAHDKPVRPFPLPVHVPEQPDPRSRGLDRTRLDLPEGPLFTFIFDYLSVFERKNPLATIDAYREAFEEQDGATLLIKSVNADRAPVEHRSLMGAATDRRDIIVRDGYLSAADLKALTRTTDVYVSLHRAEGFGLTMAEAMAYGKPVVATAYSGNLDFMTPDTAMLVPYELVEIPEDCDPYVPGDLWADPDVVAAARAMRSLFDDREGARELGARARQHIIDEHSVEVRGHQLREQLAEIRASDRYTKAIARRRRVATTKRLWSGFRARIVAKARDVLARLLRPELERLRADISQLVDTTRHIEAVPYVANRARIWTEEDGVPVLGFDRDPGSSRSGAYVGRYRQFESVFRGSEELIQARMARYVDLIRRHHPDVLGSGPVLDVGCGRGEMLEVLRAAGVDAVGIDDDMGMVERSRSKGLAVQHGDAFAFLQQPSASPEVPDTFATVFAIHVVEHLPPDRIVEFLSSARERLAGGGLLVLETVNPNSLAALKTFWVDLTHVHPIYPEVAVTLCRQAGFGSARVRFPHSDLPYEEAMTNAGEFAVLARRSTS